MDNIDQEKLHATISDLRLKLNQAVGPIVAELGYDIEKTQQMMNIVQPSFIQAWFNGVEPDQALAEAIRKGDFLLSCKMLEEDLAAGATPEQAFNKIKLIKLRAGSDPGQAALAEVAFLQQLSSGQTATESLQAAFSAAH